MFTPKAALFRDPYDAAPPPIHAIERQIVRRLAKHLGNDPHELELELRSAAGDLPVDARSMRSILGLLEGDFAVSLPYDETLKTRLDYVHDLASIIQKRMIQDAA